MQDFGITREDLARAPKPVLSHHRMAVVVGAYLIFAAVVFAQILHVSDSLPAAAFFTVITLAAGSVLLLPVLVLVMCVGERAEERWLCRRVPMLEACLAYRRALAEHRRADAAAASRVTGSEDWSLLSHGAAVELVRVELVRRLGSRLAAVDREIAGIDFMIDIEDRRLLVRCEPGTQPVQPAVGRELAAALADFGADAALVVTGAGPSPALGEYISGRPILTAAPSELDAVVTALGFRPVCESPPA